MKKLVPIVVILLLLPVVLALPNNFHFVNSGKRVITESADEAALALSKGCTEIKQVKSLIVLRCSEAVATELNLQEDIRVFAVDTGANTQIRANLVQTTNTGVGRKIVVLDTGYNYNHPELSSSYGGGKDFVNDDTDPFDDNGHGTHVAGLITADGLVSRAKGVAPDATVIAGKVLSASGSGYFSDVVAAIYWAVDGPDGVYGTADDFNADAISLSLGTAPPYTYKGFCNNVLPSLTNAIIYARSKGVLVVVAAGNSGGAGVSIPGCISYSTTVGAVDSTDKVAKWSGKGNGVDITAPGVSLYSTWLGTGYATASGTSMATPVVSGTVALIKSAHPTYTVSQVESALFNTAKDLGKSGYDTSYGYGRVDAYSAVNY